MSATTPWADKIARDVNEATRDDIISILMDFQHGRATAVQAADRIATRCDAFAAQAREPLVEALKQMPRLAYGVLVTQESAIRPMDLAMELQCICDAALTGTEEKPLVKDKERLDWLEKQPAFSFKWYYEEDGFNSPCVQYGPGLYASGVREAIDQCLSWYRANQSP